MSKHDVEYVLMFTSISDGGALFLRHGLSLKRVRAAYSINMMTEFMEEGSKLGAPH